MIQETQDNQALAKHPNPERQRLAVLVPAQLRIIDSLSTRLQRWLY